MRTQRRPQPFFVICLFLVSHWAVEAGYCDEASILRRTTAPASLESEHRGSLRGRVLDGHDGPVEGADVRCSLTTRVGHAYAGGEREVAVWNLTTDADGDYQLTDLEWKDGSWLEVAVRAPHHADSRTYVYRKELNSGRVPNIRLRKGRSIAGRCVDDRGNVLPDIEVRAAATGGSPRLWWSDIRKTDTRGAFELIVPRDNRVHLVFRSEEHINTRLKVDGKPDDTKVGDVTLTSGPSLDVVLATEEGKPIQGCLVVLQRLKDTELPVYETGLTDQDGRLRLPTLGRGDYIVYSVPYLKAGPFRRAAVSANMNWSFIPRVVTIDDKNDGPLVINPVRTVTISGSFHDLAGNAMRDMWVIVQYRHPLASHTVLAYSASTDRNGQYVVKHVPQGLNSLTVGAPGRTIEGKYFRASPTEGTLNREDISAVARQTLQIKSVEGDQREINFTTTAD